MNTPAPTIAIVVRHDVRHAYATMSLRAGANLEIVSSRLGHATVAFTLDTYTEGVPMPRRRPAICSSTPPGGPDRPPLNLS